MVISFGSPTQCLILLTAAHYALSATYSMSSSLTGQEFINAFTWETKPDANYGRVNYIDLPTAKSKGLVSVSQNQVTLRTDSTTKLDPTGPGRDAFYLTSNNQYTTHVAMHVVALGQLSELGENWPNGGEIDVVEGVNDQSPNTITLHTGANCTMPSPRKMSGTSQSDDCDVYTSDNLSCAVTDSSLNSFGPSFNSAGGGWYAIERTPAFIKVYFWSRWCPTVPDEVSNPCPTINTDNWGEPVAYFPSSKSCDFATHLSAFNIMIDIDLCGAWAGRVYNESGCPSTCTDYVNSNPSAFRNAFFTFNALTIYE